MFERTDRRRAGAYAVAGATALLTIVLEVSGAEAQPVAIPLFFGLALAAAIDPDRWVAHVLVVVAMLVAAELAMVIVNGHAASGGLGRRALVPGLLVGVAGAAVVRLACRSAT